MCCCHFPLLGQLAFALCIEVLLYWGQKYLYLLYLLFGLIPWLLCSILVSCNNLYFKVLFIWYEYCYSSLFLTSICMEYLFATSHFQSVSLGLKWVSFRYHIYRSCFCIHSAILPLIKMFLLEFFVSFFPLLYLSLSYLLIQVKFYHHLVVSNPEKISEKHFHYSNTSLAMLENNHKRCYW